MKKTILITGGAGFIGSNFAHYIFNKYKDYKVLVLDALTYAGSVDNFPINISTETNERFSFWYGNILNTALVDQLIEQANIVVHFAAESHVSRSIYDNLDFFKTDVLGTHTLVSSAYKYRKKIEKFIHISTSEVYGTALTEKMSENHPLNSLSPYAAAKVGADRLVYSYYQTYKLPVIIVRPFNNFGPKQHLEKAIPRFITSILLDEPIKIHGDGSAARDFVFVIDVCNALDMLIHTEKKPIFGEVFNIGSEKHRTIESIANDIISIMGKGTKKYIGDRPGQVFRHTADCSKIKKQIGWKPNISWEDGLKITIDWYKNNEELWKKQLWMRDIPIVTASGKVERH